MDEVWYKVLEIMASFCRLDHGSCGAQSNDTHVRWLWSTPRANEKTEEQACVGSILLVKLRIVQERGNLVGLNGLLEGIADLDEVLQTTLG